MSFLALLTSFFGFLFFSIARKFAEGAIKKQRSAFKRWGVMADW